MAIKDQCAQCKLFDEANYSLTNTIPNNNHKSCEQYRKRGINLDKKEKSNTKPLTTPAEYSEENHANTPTAKQRMFQHPFSFKGRIRRLEFGLSYILVYVYAIAIGFVVGINGGGEGSMYICLIPAYWFMWAQGAKRCHDRGNSGWFQIIPLYVLWMLLGDGEEHDNEYGSDPKGRNNI